MDEMSTSEAVTEVMIVPSGDMIDGTPEDEVQQEKDIDSAAQTCLQRCSQNQAFIPK